MEKLEIVTGLSSVMLGAAGALLLCVAGIWQYLSKVRIFLFLIIISIGICLVGGVMGLVGAARLLGELGHHHSSQAEG